MTRSTFALVALSASALTALVAAQNGTDFPININSVDTPTRIQWCNAEHNNCQGLCGGPAMVTSNDCDYNTLAYKCTCSNGTAPGLQYYSDTMPSLICQEAQKECIKTNENNLSGQQNCTNTIGSKCGTQDPTKLTGSSSSSPSGSGSSTGPATSPTTGGGTAPPTTSSPPSKAGAVNVAALGNGFAALAAALFAAMF